MTFFKLLIRALWSVLIFWMGCGDDLGLERSQRLLVDTSADSVHFYPWNRKFITGADSIPVLFIGLHRGFSCARFVHLGLDVSSSPSGPFYFPTDTLELPGYPNCPVEKAPIDTLIWFPFRSASSSAIFLGNSDRRITDTALFVFGRSYVATLGFLPNRETGLDTLMGPDSAGYIYRDGLTPMIFTTLPGCDSLNFAQFRRYGDSVQVDLGRISWRNTQSGGNSCVAVYRDSVLSFPDRFSHLRGNAKQSSIPSFKHSGRL